MFTISTGPSFSWISVLFLLIQVDFRLSSKPIRPPPTFVFLSRQINGCILRFILVYLSPISVCFPDHFPRPPGSHFSLPLPPQGGSFLVFCVTPKPFFSICPARLSGSRHPRLTWWLKHPLTTVSSFDGMFFPVVSVDPNCLSIYGVLLLAFPPLFFFGADEPRFILFLFFLSLLIYFDCPIPGSGQNQFTCITLPRDIDSLRNRTSRLAAVGVAANSPRHLIR